MTIDVTVQGNDVKGIFQQEGREQRNFETTLGQGGAFKTVAKLGAGQYHRRRRHHQRRRVQDHARRLLQVRRQADQEAGGLGFRHRERDLLQAGLARQAVIGRRPPAVAVFAGVAQVARSAGSATRRLDGRAVVVSPAYWKTNAAGTPSRVKPTACGANRRVGALMDASKAAFLSDGLRDQVEDHSTVTATRRAKLLLAQPVANAIAYRR